MRFSPASWGRILPRSFYARPTIEVARDLLGCCLVHGERAGKIVEVEAYLGLEDRAAHASRGLTARTKVLFGPPGHAYVYLIYGMYECLNLVAELEATPGCVLIRALEPVSGLDGARPTGPGRLTRAMGITRRHNGVDVTRGELVVRRPEPPEPVEILTTARIGITHCADWPLRFYVAGNRWVSPVPARSPSSPG
jgi:DNA-3-methyladenine glycosylase